MERICSDVAILHGKRIVLHIGIDELKEEVRRVSGLASPPPGTDVLAHTGTACWLRNWREHDLSLDTHVDEPTLEELFLDITA